MAIDASYATEVSKLPYLHRQSLPGSWRSIASLSIGSLMLIGAHAPVLKGQTPEHGWLKHAIETRWVELTPPSGRRVRTACYGQAAKPSLTC